MIDCWFMSTYVNEYNHEFSTNYADEREWNSHKKIDLSTRDMIYYLQENNNRKWMDWISQVVSGGTASVKLNDKVGSYIKSYKGVR